MQSPIASFLLLIRLISIYLLTYNYFMIYTTIILKLILKLGLSFLHFWFPIISIYINWNIILIFYSKNYLIYFHYINFLSLVYIYINYSLNNNYLTFIIFKITNIKQLIAYLFINQKEWILFIMTPIFSMIIL